MSGDKNMEPTQAAQPTPGYNNKIPQEIMTPDTVQTRIGTLNFENEADLENLLDRLEVTHKKLSDEELHAELRDGSMKR